MPKFHCIPRTDNFFRQIIVMITTLGVFQYHNYGKLYTLVPVIVNMTILHLLSLISLM